MRRTPARSLLAPLTLLACAACASRPETALPTLTDVSGDDCTASALVYDRPPAQSSVEDPGIPFVNDGCIGDRIFLGIGGERRELTRAENVPLGTGGEYSDGEYRVLVKRGRMVSRVQGYRPPDAACPEDGESEYEAEYEARVRIRSRAGSWTIRGTLRQPECGP